MKQKCVRDIMLPLSEYAIVSAGATLMEALEALDAAQEKVPQGRHPHRAVLVQNTYGEIIGKLGHLAFLRALLPEAKPLLDADLLDRAGVTEAMTIEFSQTMGLLSEEMVDFCRRARNAKVADFCAPANAVIDEETPLFEAIQRFVNRHTLSLLVQKGRKTVGVLRLSDLFDEVARQVRDEQCGEKKEDES